MKRVLFLCFGNSARMQIAMGWARKLGADKIEAHSTVPRRIRAINPYVIEVMAEKGVDLRGQRPKLAEEIPHPVDLIIAVGNSAPEQVGEAAEGPRIERWDLPDPNFEFGTDSELRERFRRTRDEIENRVRELVARP